MQGIVTVCTTHNMVFSASPKCRGWQQVSIEQMNELLATAQEFEGKVYEEPCKLCPKGPDDLYYTKFTSRYYHVACRELGSGLITKIRI